MLTLNPSEIYRRSLEDENLQLRQQVVNLKYHMEIEREQVVKLREEAEELRGQLLELERDFQRVTD